MLWVQNGSPKGIAKKFIGSTNRKSGSFIKMSCNYYKGKDHKKGCDNIILPLDLEKETKEKVSYTLDIC